MDQTHEHTPPAQPSHDPMPAVRLEEILALWSIKPIVLSNTRIEMARKHIAELVAEIRRLHGTAGCELCGAACCPNCSYCHGCKGYLCPKCNEDLTHVCPQKALGVASTKPDFIREGGRR